MGHSVAHSWLIISALLVDLHRRFCDEDKTGTTCEKTEDKFLLLPILAFVCMGTWVS